MNKDNFLQTNKYQIGSAGQITPVKPIAVTHSVSRLTHDYFRFGIFSLYTRHY